MDRHVSWVNANGREIVINYFVVLAGALLRTYQQHEQDARTWRQLHLRTIHER